MTAPRLDRELTLRDAVTIGLAAMIGAGVFSVFAPAARAAGSWLLIGLLLAAFIAFANASSTGQLAAATPRAGGAYRFGRDRLGEWPGFLAGWGFVIGKTASCAAMALTASAYLVPEHWQRPAAILAVVLIVALDVSGVRRTARAARWIVGVVLLVFALVLASAIVGALAGVDLPGARSTLGGTAPRDTTDAFEWYGVLQSGGLLFFAFAGYARIATLSEEVRDPRRTIPRAIGISLVITVVLYLALGLVALGSLGTPRLAASAAPLVDVVIVNGWPWAGPLVSIAAGLAALGAMLALVAGIGRTSLAMARDRELPHALAAVHPRTHTPYLAEIIVGAVVIVLIVLVDLRGAIGFSSFGVLVYYLIANLAALRQPDAERRVPRWLSAAGAIGCVILVATLPLPAVIAGLFVFAVGIVVRLTGRGIRRRSAPLGR